MKAVWWSATIRNHSSTAGLRARQLVVPSRELAPPSHAGSRAPLYVKCLAVGSQLLVHWVGASGGKVPLTLELDTAAYTIDAPAAPACYQRTNELVSKLGCGRPAAFTLLGLIAACCLLWHWGMCDY